MEDLLHRKEDRTYTLIPYGKGFYCFDKPSSIHQWFERDGSSDCLKGEPETATLNQALSQSQVHLNSIRPVVWIFFYEMGNGHKEVGRPLAIRLQYERATYLQTLNFAKRPKVKWTCEKFPSKVDYEKAFKKVQEHLSAGDCYQINLTAEFSYRGQEVLDPWDWPRLLWEQKGKRGAYGNITYIQALERSFVSNSPECLFQLEKADGSYWLSSMPIKGTVRLKNHAHFKEAWNELIHCSKNEAELLMITDLLRNDLTHLSGSWAQVRRLKAPLIVPDILHQYSLITTPLKREHSLGEVMASLFPGGSITGAPKKRVCELIREIEKRNRGFYCGSTYIQFRHIAAASINIRSGEFQHKNSFFKYGAGGGITLQSSLEDEYAEMILKTESFFKG